MPRSWPDSGVLNVQYRFIDGHHVFTSEEVDGLYVASQDPRRAYDDLSHAIKQLVLMNDHVSIELSPMLNFREFLSQARRTAAAGEPPFELGPQQFAVKIAA
jgi:hypothetical protein